uniref:BPTI/Kunitz inhibitor domain-containing protein n=1 Tax=Panagrellus redivivus TaxID=6233 RepID=A0A7E4W6X3_PANRE
MQRVLGFIVFGVVLSLVAADDKCLEGRDRGDNSCGEAGGLRFYYDKTTKHCQPFFYNGCGGTGNRFASAAECRETCSNVTVAKAQSMVISVPKCAGNVRAAVDANVQPLTCDACPSGYSCSENLCCPSKEAACDIDYDAGKFAMQGSHTPRYFYSKSAKSCLLFTYYGALGNANNFETFNDCMNFCNN